MISISASGAPASTVSRLDKHTSFIWLTQADSCPKDDYKGGYLNKIRDLIQAEVFESELEQAEELLHTGYLTPAAVIAGTVLETTIRQMCLDKQIAIGKLDKMNADLAKAGVYNSLVQKQITALAGIRNDAAHGKPADFGRDDVANMIRDVRRFAAKVLET